MESGSDLGEIDTRPSKPSILADRRGRSTISVNGPRQESNDRRDDPLGITVLYRPQRQHTADIIFVHGLGGSSLQTWTKDQDPSSRWPQRWLPLEPDICTARILTFGYNARFQETGPSSISTILDFAESLLFDMKYGKDDTGQGLAIGDVMLAFKLFGLIR